MFPAFLGSLPVVIGCQIPVLLILGAYRGMWRYFGLMDCVVLGQSVAMGTVASGAIVVLLNGHLPVPAAVYVIHAALLFISPRPRNLPIPDLFSDTIQIAGVITPVRNVLTIAAAAVMLTLFALVMKRTMLGIAMRAAASHFTMARMLGVPANLVISAAFAISGLLAGVVALFWLARSGTVVPGIGLGPLLVAFIATVIGGMRSLQGAVLGGFLLAFIDTGLNYTLPQDLLKFRDAFTFSLVILILLWRSEGLIKGPATGRRT